VLVVPLSVSARARADELPLTLSYSAPPECPTLEAVRNAVRRLTAKQAKPYSARVVIDDDQQRFTARITASDGTERTLVGSSCSEVVEATAVVISLAISPSEPSPSAETTPKPMVSAPPAPSSRAANPARPTVRFKLGAAGVLDLGTLPHLDLGGSARAGVTAQRWSAALDAAYWFLPEQSRLAQNSNFSGDFSWWTVLATGCAAPKTGSPRIELCAGPELGRLTGHGGGVTFTHDASTFRFGFQALGEVHLPLSERLRLRAGLGAALVVVGRRTFQIDGQKLYQPQLFSGRGALGVEFIF
jgi:hypothetical protein